MKKTLFALLALSLASASAHAGSTGDSLEPELAKNATIVARCDYNAGKPSHATLFLAEGYMGLPTDSLLLVQNGDAMHFFVSGKIKKDGAKVSARVDHPVGILVEIEGAGGVVTLSDGHGDPSVVNAECKLY